MKINMRDISDKTGFSMATVSNALNRKKGVNEETASKILKAARELGYIGESSITKIKLVMVRKNGKILDDTPFFPMLIDGFENGCREHGYETTLLHLDMNGAFYKEEVKNLLSDSESAVVLLATELEEEDLAIFKDAQIPFLVMDNWQEQMDFDAVLINNYDSAKCAVRYLVEHGHQRIGYLRGDYRIHAFRFREKGYLNVLEEQGLPCHSEDMVTLRTNMQESYLDMQEYLKKKPVLPTAFFADNDVIALGAMKALSEAGIKVPEEVSVVGFDDLPFCEISSPRLTSIKVPKQEMGYMAAVRIVERIKSGKPIKLKSQISTEFVERESVKRL